MLHEFWRRIIPISKNEEPLLTWHNNILTVRTEKGIQVYEFSYDLQCLDKNLDFLVSFIPNSVSSPTAGMFPKRVLKNKINNLDLTQMILDPGLWSHNELLMQEMANFVAFEWSPSVMHMHNSSYILAVLNNMGNVEFYGPERSDWTCVLNLSAVIRQRYVTRLEPVSLEEIKKTADVVISSAIHWGPRVDSNACYFTTAQRNGNILFWLLHSCGRDITTQFCGEIKSEIGEIISILWIPKSHNEFLLTCSNSVGQLFAFDCQIIKDIVNVGKKICLWSHKDRMIAKYIVTTEFEENMLLIFNKHRHVVVQMLDKSCNILTQVIHNVNDFRITDVISNNDGIFLVTVNCKIHKINFIMSNGKLDVTLVLLETKESYSTHEVYNLSFSANNVMLALAMIDKKLWARKHQPCIEIIFLITSIQSESEISLLLNNPTKSLFNHWDCIEYLRYKTMKQKALPYVDFVQLYVNGNSDIYKLKLYLKLVVLYNALDKIIKNGSRGLLPETSIEVVKENIFVAHATKLINDLFIMSQNCELNNFEIECLNGAKKYLEYFCKKKNRHMVEFIPLDVLNMLNIYIEYICQCCEETVEGFSCKNGHINMFCTLTFSPIVGDDYLICKGCGSLARIELSGNNPQCIFCDKYLSNYCLT